MSVAKPNTAKVKQSIPKTVRYLEVDVFAQKRKPPIVGPSSLTRPSTSASTLPRPIFSKSSSSSVQLVNKSAPRMVAETKLVDNGQHRIVKKMTFDNALTNVGSQSLNNVPVAKVKPLEYA